MRKEPKLNEMSNRFSAFCITRNESQWIGFSIMSTKDFIEEYVYFDGNSTDGTVELLKYIRDKYKVNIKVVEHQDPKDLQEDYVRIFNENIKALTSDYAFFLHPDMICTKGPSPELWDATAYHVKIRSFSGEPGESLQEITEGRTDRWKAIMRNGMGLHYYGHYGAGNEDMYFKDLTGDEHLLYENFASYPYEVCNSGIELNHYSDVRSYARRYGRMCSVLKNQYPEIKDEEQIKELAKNHPRVSLEPNPKYGNFKFEETRDIPEVFHKYNDEFAEVCKKKPEDFCFLPLKEFVNA